MHIQLILTILISACFANCTNTQTSGKEVKSKIQLIKTDSIQFPLPVNAVAQSNSIALFQTDSNLLLYSHSGLNSATVYSMETGTIYKSIQWDHDGPNGVKSKIGTILPIDIDRIVLVFPDQKKLYFSNSQATISSVQNIDYEFTQPQGSYVRFSNFSPVISNASKIILPTVKTFWNDFDKAYGLIEIDTKAGTTREIAPFPKTISESGWWDSYHTWCAAAINSTNQMVISIGIDQDIHVIKNDLEQNYYAGSKRIKDRPKHKARPKEFSLEEFEGYWSHIYNTGWYAGILYDKWNKLYYRFGYAAGKDDFISPNQIFENPFIVILNEKFERLGEFTLNNDEYDLNRIFVAPKGLYVFNKAKHKEDEDYLKFDVFNVVE